MRAPASAGPPRFASWPLIEFSAAAAASRPGPTRAGMAADDAGALSPAVRPMARVIK